MEQQIQRERNAIRAEEEQREKKTRKELEAVLEMKDAQVSSLMEKQKNLQVRITTMLFLKNKTVSSGMSLKHRVFF